REPTPGRRGAGILGLGRPRAGGAAGAGDLQGRLVSDAAPTVRDGGLSAGVLRHLDAQIASTQRLLEAVLRQGKAIRRRDVEAVLALVAQIREEMDGRGRLEAERT